jgi:hypothetical protein
LFLPLIEVIFGRKNYQGRGSGVQNATDTVHAGVIPQGRQTEKGRSIMVFHLPKKRVHVKSSEEKPLWTSLVVGKGSPSWTPL